MSRARAFLDLLRPQQWVKNAFVLVGLIFGHAYRESAMITAALAATGAFCLASGAVYAFNDARDAAQDRDHPDKRSRPVARGAVTQGEAAGFSAFTAAIVFGRPCGSKTTCLRPSKSWTTSPPCTTLPA